MRPPESRRPLLLLIHGWGFDAGFWTPLREALPETDCVTWDLGFRGVPARPALPAERPVVAVGHSLGLLWLLHERPVEWRALVSVNGFSRFAATAAFPGVPPRLLARMRARLDQAPVPVTTDFLTRCGDSGPWDDIPFDPQRLAWGLDALALWDEMSRAKVDLVLAGRDDPIVSEAMTRAAFPGAVVDWHDGGHLLPSSAADWCAGKLRRLVESLEYEH